MEFKNGSEVVGASSPCRAQMILQCYAMCLYKLLVPQVAQMILLQKCFFSSLSSFSSQSSLKVLCNLAHICLIAQSPVFDIPYHASWPDKARIVWQDCKVQIRSASPGRLPTYRSHSSQLCAFEPGHLAVELSFLCVYVFDRNQDRNTGRWRFLNCSISTQSLKILFLQNLTYSFPKKKT